MTKILVLGSTGMAGHVITIYLHEKGYDVTAFTRKPFPYCKNIIGDVLDLNATTEIVMKGNYDFIINCIGLLNNECEINKSKAIYLNSFLPNYLADITTNLKTKIIHLSTDCVFSGNNAPYYENSIKDGLTMYDRTKSLGEINDYKNLTFRNSIIGPDMSVDGIGLFNWFMKQKNIVNGYNMVNWTGVTTLELAKAINFSINNNINGIYHLVNNISISKYSLISLIKNEFKLSTIINETNTPISNKILISTRDDFKFKVNNYDVMIREIKDWIYSHRYLYPHYFEEKK